MRTRAGARILADLHNHSCLSPCGSLENSPALLARTAASRGITMMALTDHNSTRNCPAFAQACSNEGIIPVFGAETTTAEEVHVLSLFGDLAAAIDWGDLLYAHLPDIANDPDRVGDQPIVDVDENILAFEERFLLSAVSLTLDEVCRLTLERGGLCIPAHIDRPVNSIASQLGFLPDSPFSALEVTRVPPMIDTRDLPLICSSDAHYPDDIARRWISFAGRPTPQTAPFDDLVHAVKNRLFETSILEPR